MNFLKKYDVIIIGGGHNGLIASIYLAMNGLKTIVLERREKLGGMADTDEYKGVKFSKAAYVLGLLPDKIKTEISVDFPTINSDYIEIFVTERKNIIKVWREKEKRIKEFEKIGEKNYRKLDDFILDSKRLLEERFTYVTRPPTIEEVKESNSMLLEETEKVLREYLDNFEELYPIFSYDFILNMPAYLFIYFFSTQWKIVKGGMGTVGRVLANRARELGVDIFTNSEVSEILIKDNSVKGVKLSNGKIIESNNIIFTGNPVLLEKLTNNEIKMELPLYRAGYGRYNIILRDNLKVNEPLKPDYFDSLIVLPQGEITLPSAVDNSLGGDVMTLMGSIEGLEDFFPDIKEKTLHIDKVNWKVVESLYNNPGGNPNHLPLSLIFNDRPKKGWGYRTPIKGLYIGGSGAYPGGQVTGVPGRNAAFAVLEDVRKNIKY